MEDLYGFSKDQYLSNRFRKEIPERAADIWENGKCGFWHNTLPKCPFCEDI